MAKGKEVILKIIEDQDILFLTVKDKSYIRNSQEIRWLQKNSRSLKILSAGAKLSWFNYFSSLVKIYFQLFFTRKKKFRVIFFGYLPQFFCPFPLFLFKGKILIADFFISLYDTMVFDRQIFSSRGLGAKITKWLDRKTLKLADYVVVDTKAQAEYFIRELGLKADKTVVLYLEADKTIYFPHPVEKPKGLESKFVVLYFGTIIPLQGVEVILKAAESLKEEKEMFFIVIGPVNKDLRYKYKHLANLLFIPWLTQTELSDHIAAADLCLAGHFDGRIEKAKRVIPGKAYIFQAMGKTMILGDNPANREVFAENDPRVNFVRMGDEKDLALKIREIYLRRAKKVIN